MTRRPRSAGISPTASRSGLGSIASGANGLVAPARPSRRVRSLASGLAFAPGAHAVAWDGADDAGAHVPAGVYFVRLVAGNTSETSRLVVVP